MTYTANGHVPTAHIDIDPATGMAYAPAPLDLGPPPSTPVPDAAPPPAPQGTAAAPETPKRTVGQIIDGMLTRPKRREKAQPATTVTNATTQVELVGQRIETVTREVAIEVDATAWGKWVNEPSGRIVAGALLGWGLRRWIPYLANAGLFSVASGVSLGVAIIMHGHRFMRPAMAQRLGVIVLIASIALQISPPRPNFAVPQWVNYVLYGASR